jgi:hypothetical protein
MIMVVLKPAVAIRRFSLARFSSTLQTCENSVALGKTYGAGTMQFATMVKFSFQFWIAETVRHGPDGNCSPDTQRFDEEKICLFSFPDGLQ